MMTMFGLRSAATSEKWTKRTQKIASRTIKPPGERRGVSRTMVTLSCGLRADARRLLRHYLHQPDVDVLPAPGLLAMDGDQVLAGLQCLASLGCQTREPVIGHVPASPA